MKVAILLACLVSTSLMAKTTITLPLEVELNGKTLTAAEVNKKLKLKGEDKIIETLVVSNDRDAYSKAHKTYWAVNAQVEELASKVNQKMYLTLSNPKGCYVGNASEAVTIISNLADGPFSDQLGLFGYKYKKETNILETDAEEEIKELLAAESATWRNWKGNDESILIAFHVSDGGDDLNEVIITKCK